MLAAGTTLGPYEILATIGAGGIGEVYRARDSRLRRNVAIKVIRPELSHDPGGLKRFEQEARTAGSLNHPNICAVVDVGTHEGAPFVVMELLEGKSLRETLRHGALPVKRALEVVRQAALGVAAAHAKGIVHRDLKPENPFVLEDGRVKVLDFGLAKLTRPEGPVPAGESTVSVAPTESGAVLGTAGYMSPEQARGEPADARSDVFALGAILYEGLTGKRAFHEATYVETLNAILNREPEPLAVLQPQVPGAVETIVRRCLEKEPAERFASAHDLALVLEVASEIPATSPAAVAAKAAAARPRRLGQVAAALALLAATILVSVFWTRATSRPPVPSFTRLTFRRGTVGSARFTSDGQSVIYSARYVGERSNLYVQRLGMPDARPLCSDPYFVRHPLTASDLCSRRYSSGLR